MNFLSLDLEFNQPSKKIIEIGAVVGDTTTGEILETFTRFIKIDEQLDPRIIKLTSITQANVDSGISLQEAYKDLAELHKKYTCFRNPFTWGGGDSESLREQMQMDDEMFVFGRRWIDIKSVFQVWKISKGMGMPGGLSKSLSQIGLQFKGKKHRAIDDAKNTFVIAHELIKRFRRGESSLPRLDDPDPRG